MPNPVTTILCPVDFSAASEEAARYAVTLAGALGAKKITFLHVYQRVTYPVPVMGGSFIDPETEEAIKEHLRRQVEGLATRHGGHAVSVVAELIEGFPHPTIVERAKELDVDLIVMSTHGRTGLGHFLLGSVAEKIIRTSPIPVCTVRVKA